jgi:hypothetical protein
MNEFKNGTSALPEQWREALAVMRESITQAHEAMTLLNKAMVELRPLFESAETLHREFSELTGPMLAAAPAAEPVPSLKVVPSAVAAPPANGKDEVKPTAAGEVPEVLHASPEDIEGMQKYTLSFKSEDPIDMMKVHTALESIPEISGMSLSDYGTTSAELHIWTRVEPGSLPLVEALQDSFNEMPKVETTDEGLLIRFGAQEG